MTAPGQSAKRPAKRPDKTIAIIGGGFSGIAVAWRLARQPDLAARIVLIEGERPFGAAYATDAPGLVLNTPAAKMSALPERPDHFRAFVAAEEDRCAPEAYVPRRLYGRYLAMLRDEACAHGVVCRTTSARGVDKHDGRFIIACDDGGSITAEQVVLAVGMGSPSVPGVLGRLADATECIVDPWSPAACRPPADTRGVALVGSGQTAVDVALELVAGGYRGPITALSRRGRLPEARETPATPQAEIDFQHMPTTSAVALQRWWREQIRAVGHAQTAHALMRPASTACWQRIAPDVRARLLRHARPFWETGRHRLAPQVAERLAAMQRSGQFRVIAGRLVDARQDMDGITLSWRPRGPHDGCESARFARVINCTGFGDMAGTARGTLLESLLAAGRVQRDQHGLGIESRDPGLHVLGALRRGRYWESTAVPELASHARDVADSLARRARDPHDIPQTRTLDRAMDIATV